MDDISAHQFGAKSLTFSFISAVVPEQQRPCALLGPVVACVGGLDGVEAGPGALLTPVVAGAGGLGEVEVEEREVVVRELACAGVFASNFGYGGAEEVPVVEVGEDVVDGDGDVPEVAVG